MAITPLDVRKKSFTTQMRGYATKEVRGFLESVANELEEARKERSALAEEVDHLRVRVAAFEETEKLVRDTLVTAQKASDDLRAATEHEVQAMKERAAAQAARLDEEMKELARQRGMLLDQIRGIANTYLAMTDRFGKDPGPGD